MPGGLPQGDLGEVQRSDVPPAGGSQIESAPSPLPMSRAVPGVSPATSATSWGLGLPLQTADVDP